MTMLRLAASIIAVALLAVPASPVEKSVEELKKELASADPNQQHGLYAELARRQVEIANDLYTAGNVPEAEAAVNQVVAYADKARDTGLKSGSKLKKTEIALRKTSRRLADVGRTLSVEYRPHVEAAVEHLEDVRRALLEKMFGLKNPKEKR
jgi:hypothetical protein